MFFFSFSFIGLGDSLHIRGKKKAVGLRVLIIGMFKLGNASPISFSTRTKDTSSDFSFESPHPYDLILPIYIAPFSIQSDLIKTIYFIFPMTIGANLLCKSYF